LADANFADLTQAPGSYVQYNNEGFDILAVSVFSSIKIT
jgi:hypothetical protein